MKKNLPKFEIMDTAESTGCLVCGEELVYPEKPVGLECVFCKNVFLATSHCPQMHYVCDECHSSSANELVTKICLNSSQTDPIALAVEIMNAPVVKMHGPEHHYIVPAVLLTCMHNSIGKPENLRDKLEIAEFRAKNVLGGYCGNFGACGAAIGTGIFMSIFTKANPLSEKEWSLANLITSQALRQVALSGGPRCCKRDTYIALEEAVKFIKKEFSVTLPVSEAKCTFSMRNRQCKHEDCIFYNLSLSLV